MRGTARILQVVEANAGGVRSVLEELVAVLAGAGHEVTVAYSPRRGPESEEAARRYAACGARTVPVPMRRSPEPWSDLRSALILRRLMRRGRFDIVHCHSSKAGVLGRVAARAAGVRCCIYSPHAFAFAGARTRASRWCMARVEKLLVPWTDHLVAVSELEGRQAVRLGMPPASVVVIPNGTRIRPFERQPVERVLRIAAAGRLTRQKGFDVLIRSMREVQRLNPEVHLAIAGDGHLRDRLLRLADRLAVRVEFSGRVPSLPDWLAGADVFVQSSRWEGMSLTLLEAVSCGVPVVATAVGGTPELIEDGRTGFLVEPGDAKALADRILSVTANPYAAWERARRAHRRLEERHDVERAAKRYLALYEQLAASASPGEHPPEGSADGSTPGRAAARPLIVVDGFPRWSETFISGEISGLRRLGIDAQVFALRPGTSSPPSGSHVVYSCGPVRDFLHIGLPRPHELKRHFGILFRVFAHDPRWLLFGLARTSTVIRVARLARKLKCTSVHAHFFGAPAVIGACSSRVAGVPFSLSPHASCDLLSSQGTARLLQRAAFTAACWKGAFRSLAAIGPRVHYVPHGVESTFFSGRGRCGSRMNILVIARMVKKKGIDVFIDALEILDRCTSDWTAVVLGDGPLRRHLEQRAARTPATRRIRFEGVVPHNQVPLFLRNADVLVVPSIPSPSESEGVPNVILEAFAAGVPVVASDTGGISEVVKHGETGILVPPGDHGALARALLRISRSEEDLPSLTASARKAVMQDHASETSLAASARLHRSVAEGRERQEPLDL